MRGLSKIDKDSLWRRDLPQSHSFARMNRPRAVSTLTTVSDRHSPGRMASDRGVDSRVLEERRMDG